MKIAAFPDPPPPPAKTRADALLQPVQDQTLLSMLGHWDDPREVERTLSPRPVSPLSIDVAEQLSDESDASTYGSSQNQMCPVLLHPESEEDEEDHDDDDELQLANFNSIDSAERTASDWTNRISNGAVAARTVPKPPLDHDETLQNDGADDTHWDHERTDLKQRNYHSEPPLPAASTNVLQLQSCIEQLRQVDKQRMLELDALQAKHDAAKRQLELSAEKDHTILFLRHEVSRLTADKEFDGKEMNRLRSENADFAAQIVQSDKEFDHACEQLALREATIEQLDLNREAENTVLPHDKILSRTADKTELETKIDDLALTLEKAEKDRHAASQSYQDQLEKKEAEIQEIRALVVGVIRKQEEPGDFEMIEVVLPSVSAEKNDEIEVLRAEIKGMKAGDEKKNDKTNDCNPFAILSDCLA